MKKVTEHRKEVGTKHQENIQERFFETKRQWLQFFAFVFILSILNLSLLDVTVFAAGEDVIKAGFAVIYDIIAAIVSSIGALFLLWGFFEWAQALNAQDGMAQAMSFKRISAGLVACMGPQIVKLILPQIQ